MNNEPKKRRSPEEVTALKARMVAVRQIIPPGGVAMFISRYPEYSSYQPSKKVELVWLQRTVDEDITTKFETMAKEYKPGAVEN